MANRNNYKSLLGYFAIKKEVIFNFLIPIVSLVITKC